MLLPNEESLCVKSPNLRIYRVISIVIHKNKFFSPLQDINEWPIIDPLPSYGRGRDGPGGRYSSLIGGTNLTDVIITGGQNVLHSTNH